MNSQKNNSNSISFNVYFSGEKGAGLRPFSDKITISCDSGQWGGSSNEFKEYIENCLKEWYDGATVSLEKVG